MTQITCGLWQGAVLATEGISGRPDSSAAVPLPTCPVAVPGKATGSHTQLHHTLGPLRDRWRIGLLEEWRQRVTPATCFTPLFRQHVNLDHGAGLVDLPPWCPQAGVLLPKPISHEQQLLLLHERVAHDPSRTVRAQRQVQGDSSPGPLPRPGAKGLERGHRTDGLPRVGLTQEEEDPTAAVRG